ncbi:hypothetical protein E8E12_003875 [Didymella heteroderae]|uniref:Uncharacterized protein n=1 Tax=Didymella heteroderae TaxID=1769908 RepID=A0A9P5BWW2_9PLEO|nr:hypothetical protein E8E12_003875 [Didymella heteroderae]
MLLPSVTELLPLVLLAATVTATPAPTSAIDATAVQSCESDYARCLRLRMSIEHCHKTVCNKYNNDCKPCQDNTLPTIYDRAFTHPTPDNSAGEVHILNSRADLLDLVNAQSGQLAVPVVDGMTTVITSLDKDGKFEGNCMWVCSGKVNCRFVCRDSAAKAQFSLVKDAGTLPEGQATEGMGKCEIVKKNKIAQIMVCQVPEAAGGDALTAGFLDSMGVHCDVYSVESQPQMTCRQVH